MRHSDITSAKSDVGIGVLNLSKRRIHRASGFFVCEIQLHLFNGGLCGGIERCASIRLGWYANPIQFTTSNWRC
ncbi:hypothetical protein EHE21_10935 [Proteus sp. GOKU]|nr:hypothetical protein EHE21_10935 [Proteus sp. GOKU]QQP25873.1 hypothetical protein D7029_10935 [Proteus vulgaris]TRY06906.1 hypothetical protein FNU71_03450 [Proteus mirabilis]